MAETQAAPVRPPTSALRLDGVKETVDATEVIRGVDWSIHEGECHVLIGPNGVGTSMLLHCDQVRLTEDAQLMTPFVNLAQVPEAASSYLLPLRIGHVHAFGMFALGEGLPAQQAVAWGFANRIVPATELRTQAQRIDERIATKPSGSLSSMKRLMRDSEKLIAHMVSERAIFRKQLASDEAKEAFTVFAQKRKADFTKFTRQ